MKTNIMKTIYILILTTYVTIFGVYMYRFEISYSIGGVKPDIIEERSLNYNEYQSLKESVSIREKISFFFFVSTFIVCSVSALLWLKKIFKPVTIPKIVFYVTLLFTLLLILVRGINFIPTGPIR